MTEALKNLLQVPFENRDLNWEENFFVSFSNDQVMMLSESPENGPDGWPYLLAETAEASKEPVQRIFHWLATRGIGLVVNPKKEFPDYVFTYGMIWHFRETGLFFRKQSDVKTGAVVLKGEQNLLAGAPTEEYLPGYVRKILREFFRDQGLLQPKILMVSENGSHYDLAFSLESLGSPPEGEHNGIAEAIAWFLPPHYSILLTSELVAEKGMPEFLPL